LKSGTSVRNKSPPNANQVRGVFPQKREEGKGSWSSEE